jgi:hypothetical protein
MPPHHVILSRCIAISRIQRLYFSPNKDTGCPPKGGEIFDPIESFGHDTIRTSSMMKLSLLTMSFSSPPRRISRIQRLYFSPNKDTGCPPKGGEIFDPIESFGHDAIGCFVLKKVDRLLAILSRRIRISRTSLSYGVILE